MFQVQNSNAIAISDNSKVQRDLNCLVNINSSNRIENPQIHVHPKNDQSI